MGLVCENIGFQYPDGTTVFSGISYAMETPGFNAMFGPSGVGKTTLAKIISGDIREFSGAVRSDGIGRIAYTHNQERLPGWASVGKHLDRIIPEEHAAPLAELIEVFGLSRLLDHRFSQLSLGQKNRINLIRYLLQGFDVLILDESLANVDEQTRERILLRIKALFPQVYFIYISHNVVEVSTFCREILVLRGRQRTPQIRLIRGQDLMEGAVLDRAALDRTMLEIMNAA